MHDLEPNVKRSETRFMDVARSRFISSQPMTFMVDKVAFASTFSNVSLYLKAVFLLCNLLYLFGII